MPRILGIDLPKEKRIEAALPYIYGIGPTRTKADFGPSTDQRG